MANVLDQADETEVVPLDVSEVRDLAIRYQRLNCGVSATAAEEATADQIAAIKAKVDMDVVPYADFAVLRPHGARLGRALRFTAKVWSAEAMQYTNREIPGPSSFEEWRRSWRVYRYALLVLGIASSAKLERYFDRIHALHRSHGELGGTNLWWLLSLAEMRMRSERMEHIRRELEADLVRLRAAGRGHEAVMDVRRPWDAVFLAAAGDEEYWTTEVKEASLLYMANLKGRGEIMDDGHGVSAGSAPSGLPKPRGAAAKGKAARNKRQREAKAAAKAAARGKQQSEAARPKTPPRQNPKKAGKPNGRVPLSEQECYRWTRDEAGCSTPCPSKRNHPACPRCGGSHPWKQPCPAAH